MVGEDKGVGDDDVFSASRGEDNDFGDVPGSKRLTSTAGC